MILISVHVLAYSGYLHFNKRLHFIIVSLFVFGLMIAHKMNKAAIA